MNPGTGECRQVFLSITTPSYGRTKSCRSRARRMNACNSRMFTRNKKKTASSHPARQTKNLDQTKWIIVCGPRILFETSCTKLGGALPIYWKKSYSADAANSMSCAKVGEQQSPRRPMEPSQQHQVF